MIRIVMADDHPMVREGIRSILARHADLDIVAEASSGAEAVAAVREQVPDLLLLDLRMPDMNGPEVTKRVLSLQQAPKVLILTTYDSDTDILPAIEAGANGYLLKDVEPAVLAQAIRDTVSGRTVLDPQAAQVMATSLQAGPQPTLSQQEVQVLRLAAQGLTNRQIAGRLFISETTVKTYFSRLFAKLGVSDRTAAVAAAYDLL
ncbi:DNA-binding response regulator [Bombiscardovia nodaiensis]|uniref:DNA-binding response regulator n=1 Tax=Bombiscardovia nodaiensis TaxID=2932181 RepID=A0ABM8B9L2_9BIFI|nr:DNA-binding response regulator [Bombiscardovia nodaiensis]